MCSFDHVLLNDICNFPPQNESYGNTSMLTCDKNNSRSQVGVYDNNLESMFNDHYEVFDDS